VLPLARTALKSDLIHITARRNAMPLPATPKRGLAAPIEGGLHVVVAPELLGQEHTVIRDSDEDYANRCELVALALEVAKTR
jgi:hypothetical protein